MNSLNDPILIELDFDYTIYYKREVEHSFSKLNYSSRM